MKIKRLRLAGFGPYKNEQLIDFERFDDDGIFLITGKTGAGKSSILDAICFALYGSVPRYDGTEPQLRSDHCDESDPTFVELEFVVGEADYRIYRTPRYERAKKRGGGTTTSQPDAQLDVRDDSIAGSDGGAGWRGVASRPVDVGNELSRVLPLTQDQFLQVILLAQNRFQKFLLAKTDDRRAVLRSLFGTSRFERLESELVARRKHLGDELTAVQQQIHGFATTVAPHRADTAVPANPGVEWFHEAMAELEQVGAVAADCATAADSAFAAATEAFREQSDLRRRQDQREAAILKMERLESAGATVEHARRLLADARRAARVWPQIRARYDAQGALDTAVAAEQRARSTWLQVTGSPEGTNAADPTASIDALLGSLGSLNDVREAELKLPSLAGEILRSDERLQHALDALHAAETHLAEIPAQLQSLDAEFAAATLLAARHDESSAELDRLEAENSAVADLASLEPKLRAAHQAEKAASAAHRDLALRYDRLLTARLAGHAAELAASLVDGEPCSVCGSPEHPNPAAADAPPLTDADIEAARDELSSTHSALDAAHDVAQKLTLSHADARARTHNKTHAHILAALAVATTTLDDARAATARLATLDDRRSALRAELDEATAQLAELRESRDDATATVTTLRSTRHAITERVARHLDGFASVTERVNRLTVELTAARGVNDAQAERRERTTAVELATAGVTAQLAEEGFGTQADAEAARLPDAAMMAHDADIRRHDDEIAGVRAVLAEPALAELPDSLIDLSEAQQSLESAGTARDVALAASSALSERISHVSAVVASAQKKVADSATLLTTQKHVRELAAVIHGEEPNTKRMRLETYVLAAQLEEIIAAANLRLRTMTGARYALEHDDSVQFRGAQSGLGLAIRDEHTGRARPTHSLSGGETFLASLALALGLAETVSNQAGGIALDTLFVDEGFGSLDSETLETAMSTLDGLRAGGRTIGLISHVESMKEQIPAKLAIVVSSRGDSSIVM
ncbi:AAA family ATPase [Glaciibacter psychrotolerans]|uniref:Nuclease SbcCD subunit C n=1 Tax=Glaciibacter psychrotolerans TaxID=670054 RepID=A0A7Z0EEC8_9MICO|nr:SMC family ATPase [Leifsonia psychrotolerans]NYJ19921.1 exonuclease SbcC [Leifsonia psychrotolerans]